VRTKFYISTALLVGLVVAGTAAAFALSNTAAQASAKTTSKAVKKASCCPDGACCPGGPCCADAS
jgi:hypothetical protein